MFFDPFLTQTFTEQAANGASLIFWICGILQRFSNGQTAGVVFMHQSFAFCLTLTSSLVQRMFSCCVSAKEGSALMQVSHRTTMQPSEELSLLGRKASQLAILKMVLSPGCTRTACPA